MVYIISLKLLFHTIMFNCVKSYIYLLQIYACYDRCCGNGWFNEAASTLALPT